MIVSVKGGTGKTLVAVNIAYQLGNMGNKVAVIDADITSPNLAEMMGINTPLKTEHTKIYPAEINDNIKVFSMSLLAEHRSISMESKQKLQLLYDVIFRTEWGDADFFVIDMPAGSSDEFKNVVKIFADMLVGSVIVIQPAHKQIAERAIKIHLDNGIPVIGLIENMSYYQQGKAKVRIFGESMIEELSEKYKVTALGKIPLSMKIRRAVENDGGKMPTELIDPISQAIVEIEKAKPEKPGFLTKLKEKAQNVIVEILSQIILASNKEVNIPELQKKYGYAGQRYIQLNILAKDMNTSLASADYIIRDGKLLQVKKAPRLDTIIEIRIDSLAKIFLNQPCADGSPYDLETSYLMGHTNIWGAGETVRGLHFMREIWNTLREEPAVSKKLKPLFTKFA